MQGKEGHPTSKQVNTMTNRNFASVLNLSFMTFSKSISNIWYVVILAGLVNTKWSSLDKSYVKYLSPVPAIFVKPLGPFSTLVPTHTAE